MNSMSMGFVFVCGVSWLLCEACNFAGQGNWWPFWAYIAYFTLLFSIMGCIPLSDTAINLWGAIFSVGMGAALAVCAIHTAQVSVSDGLWRILNPGVSLRLIGAAVLVMMGILGFSINYQQSKAEAH
ncbi:MAG: hypothetical protein AAF236_16410 [Verrucomicrobiota bacterium]